MKHAWLIIAHNNISQLLKLIKFLDRDCNDIFIHMDKKNKEYSYRLIKETVKCARVYEPEKRLSVTWGGHSQCWCELTLIKAAMNNALDYDYLHLISNADVPIKPWSSFENFFEANNGKQFLSLGVLDDNKELYHRCGAYHLFQDMCGRNRIILRSVDRILFRCQRILGINRIKENGVVWYKGSNWFSITGECAAYVISKENWIRKRFSYSFCCDEIMINTLVANSKFRDSIYKGGKSGANDQSSSLRLVDWSNREMNSPHTFTFDDKERLLGADEDLLLARKFDETVDNDIIDFMYNKVMDVQEK